MLIRVFFVSVVFFGLFLGLLGLGVPLTWQQAMVVTPAVLLILTGHYATQGRRVAAIERYLTIQAVNRNCEDHRTDVPAGSEDTVRSGGLAAELKFHLNRIVGERHPKTSRVHHDRVRDMIADHMSRLGWSVRLEQVHGPNGIGHNVIAEKKSPNPDAEIVIVGAHYDTVQGSPGADDNGIAVAGIMALGQWLGQYDFEKTVRLVAWDLEEQQGWGIPGNR